MMGAKLPRVYPILDTAALEARGLGLAEAAAALVEGGAEILQIRHKGPWSRAVFAAAGRAAAACRQAGASLVIDDRADFALLLEAGLHVGQSDLPPEDARRLLGPDALLGLSCHDAEQLLAAAAAPVDYAALGPVFPTASKRQPDAVVGLADLRRWRALIPKPLAAIGGITLENAVEVWRAGADAAAIIAGLLPDPSTARGLRDRMEQWRRLATTV